MSRTEDMRRQQMIVNNPCQGNDERVLVVCTVGLLRSPTVVRVANEMKMNLNMRSVGIDVQDALIPISDKLLDWADTVIAMDYSQSQEIHNMGFKGDIYNFNIFDDYDYNDPRLVEIIQNRFNNMSMFLW